MIKRLIVMMMMLLLLVGCGAETSPTIEVIGEDTPQAPLLFSLPEGVELICQGVTLASPKGEVEYLGASTSSSGGTIITVKYDGEVCYLLAETASTVFLPE